MAKVNNNEVVRAFLNKQNAESHTGALRSAYGRLWSYDTVIAEYDDGFLYINRTKYSRTTSSKHQSPLYRQVNDLYRDIDDAGNNIIYVINVPFEHTTLTDCVVGC